MKWDPDTVIPLINPVKGWGTCVGFAPSKGRRCWNRKSPLLASRILNDLAELSPSSAAASPRLLDAAESMLCWLHGDQADKVISEWKRALMKDATTTKQTNRDWDEMAANAHAVLDELLRKRREREETRGYTEKGSAFEPQFRWSPSQTHSRDESDDDEATASRERQRKEEKRERRREKERQEKEREEEEREEEERQEEERRERRRREKKRREKERREKEREEEERQEEKRREKESQDKERSEKRRREREAQEEKIRKRAAEARAARAEAAEQRRLAEQREWAEAWKRYTKGWELVEANQTAKITSIPWPTRSGRWEDVTENNVREFFRRAPTYEASREPDERFCLMSKENKRWHTDKILSRFGRQVLVGSRKGEIDLVTKLMVVLWKEAKITRASL